jgi:uncharacterized protein (DUF488 family)
VSTQAVPAIATIGVYGTSVDGFLAALREADVGLLLDVRQRRGVRGRQYAWANSLRLQAALAQAGIAYRHELELAPTTELRELQYAEDARVGVGKRTRVVLATAYRRRYVEEILDRVDLAAFVESLPRDRRSALLCVERDPRACHRSLIAARLVEDYAADVIDLMPAAAGGAGLRA